MHPIIQRLKERKLVQWALAYLAGAWVLYQVLQGFGEAWGMSTGVLRLAQVALVVGFFVVLVLAWYHGEQGHQRVTGPELVIIAGLLGVGGGLIALLPSPPDGPRDLEAVESRSVTRFSISAPDGMQVSNNGGVAISPDGQTIVFAVHDTSDFGRSRLYRRDRDRLDLIELPTAPGDGETTPYYLFFSPDGEWVGFFDQTDSGLRKVRVDGSDLQTITTVRPTQRSAGWRSDGTIVFRSTGFEERDGLFAISEAGGDAVLLPGTEGRMFRWLELLPGDEIALGSRSGSLVALRLETGEETLLFEGRYPRFAAGYLTYYREGAIWAVPFDVGRLEATGEHRVVVNNVAALANIGLAGFDVHPDVLAYVPGAGEISGSGVPVWVSSDGTTQPLAVPAGSYRVPRLSPDGSKLAIQRVGEGWDIWIHDLQTGSSQPLAFEEGHERHPVWTPDGEFVVYRSNRDGPYNLYRRRADGSEESEPLTNSPHNQWPLAVTPDGSTLIFAEEAPETGWDLWSIALSDPLDAAPILKEPYDERGAAVSPDGRWLAYESFERGYSEVMVRPLGQGSGEWLVSTRDGIAAQSTRSGSDLREGRLPVWDPKGQWLYYRSGRTLFRLAYSVEGAAFVPATPEVVSDRWYESEYDVSPTDDRFLMVRYQDEGLEGELVVVENWVAALADRGSGN